MKLGTNSARSTDLAHTSFDRPFTAFRCKKLARILGGMAVEKCNFFLFVLSKGRFHQAALSTKPPGPATKARGRSAQNRSRFRDLVATNFGGLEGFYILLGFYARRRRDLGRFGGYGPAHLLNCLKPGPLAPTVRRRSVQGGGEGVIFHRKAPRENRLTGGKK
jgi:hypothetical protein